MIDRQNLIAIVFDDHKLFAESFSLLLEQLDMFKSVLFFSEEKDLTQYFINNSNKQQEIYFFVDYYLKEKHSLPLINNVKRLNKQINIIILSNLTDPTLAQNILSHNPNGFLSKSNGFSEILDCIRAIRENKTFISPFFNSILNQATKVLPSPFTSREVELLQYFNRGYSIADTAEKVHLSKHTIVAHRRNMMEKATCNSITELLAFARDKGLI